MGKEEYEEAGCVAIVPFLCFRLRQTRAPPSLHVLYPPHLAWLRSFVWSILFSFNRSLIDQGCKYCLDSAGAKCNTRSRVILPCI